MYSIKRFLHFPSKLVSSFSASEEMTVFQSSFIQKMFWQNVWVYALRRRSFPVTYVVFDDNHPALVFPALQRNNMVELAGSVNGISSLSPIYFENTANYPQCLKYLIDCLPATTISFDRIIDHTPTSDLLKALQADETYLVEKTTSDNVEITFSDSYENWYSGLKKSVRQNLRTAYNRVNTDSLSIQFDVWHGGAIPSAVMHELVQVYNERHTERYGVKTSSLKRFYLQHIDFSTRSLRKCSDARHGIIRLNGQIAAFYSGYYNKRTKSIIVPRLSINSNYSRYSPGYLLISEAIRFYSSDSSVIAFDLSTGLEQYKLDLGGKIYQKSKWILKKKN